VPLEEPAAAAVAAESSESGSETDTSSLPEIPVEGSSPPEQEGTGAGEGEGTGEGTGEGANGLIRGGRTHFVQHLRKNKTHRHHKRRNRHQTLRHNLSK